VTDSNGTSETETRNLAERIRAVSSLRGNFTLRSGQRSDFYFDKYLFEGDPSILRDIATVAAPLIPPRTQVLAGLELGGVPLATALSLETGLPAAFVRKRAKSYGTLKLAEGAAIDQRRVLIVEDVITTGGQVALSLRDLRERGAVIDHVLCVIDRRNGQPTELDDLDVTVIALFRGAEVR
jgi:orotate phosphoribosyltransferase